MYRVPASWLSCATSNVHGEYKAVFKLFIVTSSSDDQVTMAELKCFILKPKIDNLNWVTFSNPIFPGNNILADHS